MFRCLVYLFLYAGLQTRANPLLESLGDLHPGRLKTKWISYVNPKGLDDMHCFNPSITGVDNRVVIYFRCTVMGFLSPRAMFYHRYDPSFIKGGKSLFVVAELPKESAWQTAYNHLLEARVLEVLDGSDAGFAPSDIKGLEDARIHGHAGRVYFTATVPEVNISVPTFMARGPYLGVLDVHRTGIEHVEKVVKGVFPEPIKNIVPFTLGDKLCLFDAFKGTGYVVQNPHQPGRPDSTLRAFQLHYPDWMQGMIRGGTPAVPLGSNRWGCFVHSSFRVPADPEVIEAGGPAARIGQDYIHLWLEFDPFTAVFSLSKPFYFLGGGVEFASGLYAEGEAPSQLVVSFGFQDIESYLAAVDLVELRRIPRLHDGWKQHRADMGAKISNLKVEL